MSTADELEDFYVLTVTVELPGVEGPWGPEPGATSPPLRCFVDDTRRLVRDPLGEGSTALSEVFDRGRHGPRKGKNQDGDQDDLQGPKDSRRAI